MVQTYHSEELQPAPYSNEGFLGTVNGKSFLHQAGYEYSQEPSAMIVGTAAAAKPGEKVLDLCAAPGGKSTQLAAQMRGKGLLVSNEIFPKRAKILSENIERWGVSNAIVTNHAPAELVPHFSGFLIGSWLMRLVQGRDVQKRPECSKRVDRRISATLSKTSARDFVFSNKDAKT